MNCEKLGQPFYSLGHRIIYAFKASFPEFIPVDSCNVSVESQKQMHEFLRDTVEIIYQNPEIINIKYEEDQCYENWMMNNRIPELIAAMEKIEKKFFDFYEYLYKIGKAGKMENNQLYIDKAKMKISKNTLEKLEVFGLLSNAPTEHIVLYSIKYPLLFPAWINLHCSIDKGDMKRTQQLTMFLHGRYLGKLYNARHMFGPLFNDQNLIYAFENYLSENGFVLSNDELCISWIKHYTSKDKAFMKIGFSWRNKNQLSYSFGVPKFRLVFNEFSLLDDDLRQLIFSRTKKCDNCGYCTQMDKTRNSLATVLSYNGESANKCPLFPNLNYINMDEKTIADLKKLFSYTERVV